MIDEIIQALLGYGAGGIILAYFLHNDYQDRKAFREEIRGNRDKLYDHETRIVVLEKIDDKGSDFK
ncbi:MAG: hypothetical protein ACRC6E_08585 [Fusobacteriaceae bacterium]